MFQWQLDIRIVHVGGKNGTHHLGEALLVDVKMDWSKAKKIIASQLGKKSMCKYMKKF
jgi:hypothetical protein